jgi:hypothetical protein
MTDTPTPDPLPPDVVDELLSARADGVFDDAAADFGMTPDQAQARLDATPGAGARARSLDAARASIAAPPALDDLSRRRLVTRAVLPERAPRRQHTRKAVLRGAGALAAIAALIALFSVASLDSPGDNDASSSGAPENVSRDENATGAAATRSAAIDNAQQLRRYVEQNTDTPAAPAAGRTTPSTTTTEEFSSTDHADDATRRKALNQRLTVTSQRCAANLQRAFKNASGPTFTATVTHKGKPADLVLYDQNGGTLAVLYDPANCRILISTFAP